MTSGLYENAYFHSRWTRSCLVDSKVAHDIQSAICECTQCREDARERSQAIDHEIAIEARLPGKQVYIQLLGYTSATDEVTRVLLRLNDSQFENVTTASMKLVLDYAKDTVKSCTGAILRMNAISSGADRDMLYKLTMINELGSNFSKNEMNCIACLWQEHCTGSQPQQLDERAYFLDNLIRITSPIYTPTQEDIRNLPLRLVRPQGSLYHTKHEISNSSTLPSAPTTYNIISRVNNNSTSTTFSSNMLRATSFIYIIDLTTYNQFLANTPPYNSNLLDDAFTMFETVLRNDRFAEAPNFLWLTNVNRFKDMVEANPQSLEGCVLGGPKALENVIKIDEWLLKELWSAELGDDNHVLLLDSVDAKHVQGALEAMANIIATKSAKVLL